MKLKFCAVCGTTKELQHHHLVPKIRGGTEDEINLLTLCYEHHCWFHKVKPSSYTKQSELIKAGLKRAAKVGIKPGRKPKYQDICAIHQIRNLPFSHDGHFSAVGLCAIAGGSESNKQYNVTANSGTTFHVYNGGSIDSSTLTYITGFAVYITNS